MKSISLIDEIRTNVRERNYQLTFHARARMFERRISNRDLVDLVNYLGLKTEACF